MLGKITGRAEQRVVWDGVGGANQSVKYTCSSRLRLIEWLILNIKVST